MNLPLPRSKFGKKFEENFDRIFRTSVSKRTDEEIEMAKYALGFEDPAERVESYEEYMRILTKAAEFYACARHLNSRGCRSVLEETNLIVERMKISGATFADLLEFINEPVDLETDRFLQTIKMFFETGKSE